MLKTCAFHSSCILRKEKQPWEISQFSSPLQEKLLSPDDLYRPWCSFILHEDPVPEVVDTFSFSFPWDSLLPKRNTVVSGFW